MPRATRRPKARRGRSSTRQATSTVRRRMGSSTLPAAHPSPTPASQEPASLSRALRESLGLPPIEEGPSALGPSEVEDGGAIAEPERPPEVRVVSVSSFVPTGHLVCEGCGRILRWTIPEGARKELAELAITSPEGWEVRALAVSFTGYCPNCRRSGGRA